MTGRRRSASARGRILALAAALGGLVAIGQLHAAGTAENPDWPCVQRKVPRLTAGMVWAGPSIQGLERDWRSEPEVSALAQNIAPRAMALEDAETAIADFATGLGVDKERMLTLLFAGVLELINAERGSIIEGIERYARRQRALAEKIESATAELTQLPAEASAQDRTRREELSQQITWDTRVFEERERSLTYICEQPVLLEQRLFALSRAIMAQLE